MRPIWRRANLMSTSPLCTIHSDPTASPLSSSSLHLIGLPIEEEAILSRQVKKRTLTYQNRWFRHPHRLSKAPTNALTWKSRAVLTIGSHHKLNSKSSQLAYIEMEVKVAMATRRYPWFHLQPEEIDLKQCAVMTNLRLLGQEWVCLPQGSQVWTKIN